MSDTIIIRSKEHLYRIHPDLVKWFCAINNKIPLVLENSGLTNDQLKCLTLKEQEEYQKNNFTNIIGYASNFRKDKINVLCDIELNAFSNLVSHWNHKVDNFLVIPEKKEIVRLVIYNKDFINKVNKKIERFKKEAKEKSITKAQQLANKISQYEKEEGGN